jgi:hypothetical protein
MKTECAHARASLSLSLSLSLGARAHTYVHTYTQHHTVRARVVMCVHLTSFVNLCQLLCMHLTNFNIRISFICANPCSFCDFFDSDLSFMISFSCAAWSSWAIFRAARYSALVSDRLVWCSYIRCFTFCLYSFNSASCFSASSSFSRSLFLRMYVRVIVPRDGSLRSLPFGPTWFERVLRPADVSLFPKRFAVCPFLSGKSFFLPARVPFPPIFCEHISPVVLYSSWSYPPLRYWPSLFLSLS